MKLSRWFHVLAPALLASLACSDPGGPAASAQITALPRDLTVAEQKMITSSNAFAFDLLRQINTAERDSNVFVSPLSASMALGMTANGAAGTTYDAFHNTLRLGDASAAEVNDGYKSLISLLTALDPSVKFQIANSIWYDQTFPFNSSFLNQSKSYFNAEVQGIDFRQPAAANTINSWVSDATAKKIPSIIDGIDPAEVMFLINAIYFKGSWTQEFEKSQTQDAPFFARDGSSSPTPLMHQDKTLQFANGAGFKAVDLYYGNSAYAMTVILPDSGQDVNAVASSFTPASWKSLVGSFREADVDFYLPRFKIEWSKILNDDLTAMGLGVAFTSGADFTPMSTRGKELSISVVKQKTFVDVNEEGTEAAAATSVGVQVTSVPVPVTVRVDRPFIFAIRERFSGTILFIGKIVKLPV
jgi:serine protease inhibitor